MERVVLDKNISTYNYIFGSLGIAPTRNCTHFLKIGLVVAGGWFNSYYIHQGHKSNKEGKSQKIKHTKLFNTLLKYGCNSTSTIESMNENVDNLTLFLKICK